MKQKNNHYKKIKPGTVIHSNDQYFQGSDGYSKSREASSNSKKDKPQNETNSKGLKAKKQSQDSKNQS